MIMGELTASIAHEVNQPLAAVVANANAGFRWLANPTPNLDEARDAISRIVRDGNRASDVIRRIRALVQKGDTEKTLLDINEVIQEVVSLTHSEIQKSGVVLKMNLAASLPRVSGDRIQLQQVILNLVMNGIEAMNTVTDRPREMLIRSSQHESDQVLVAVQDSGIGIDHRISIRSSILSTPPSRRAWVWDWRSAVRLLRTTAGGFGPYRMTVPGQRFNLRF